MTYIPQKKNGYSASFRDNWYAVENPNEAVGGGVDSVALTGWIDDYCSTHPLDPVVIAADRLIGEPRRREAGQGAR
jgi:hypothetical protein